MTRVGVQGMARELASSPVPVTMTLTVQAWAGDAPYQNVEIGGPVFGPKVTVVVHADGRVTLGNTDGPEVELRFPPTDGAFCYRWEASRASTELPPRFTEMPDVEDIQFGELQQVNPATFEPVEDVLDAWATVREDTFQARDDTQGLRDETQTLRNQAGTSADAAGVSAGAASTSADTASTAATTATTAAGTASSAATAAGTARDGAVAARTAAESARDQAQAVAASKGQPNGIGSLDASGKQPEAQVPDRLTSQALNDVFEPGGTAGSINKSTAQGIALVQALIFGGN